MAFVDWSLVTSSTIALLLVFLPVEVFVLFYVRQIKSKAVGLLSSPAQRATVFHELATAVFEPLSKTETLRPVLHEAAAQVWELLPLRDPKLREELTLEMGHRIARIIDERVGAIKGSLIKQGKAMLLDGALETGDPRQLVGALGNKEFDVPLLGKVNVIQGLQIMQALRSQMGGGTGGSIMQLPNLTPGSSNAGYPK